MLISNLFTPCKINNNYNCQNKQIKKFSNVTDTFEKSNVSFEGAYRHQGLYGTDKELAWALNTPLEWIIDTIKTGKIAEVQEYLPVSFLNLMKSKLACLLVDRNFSPKLIKYVKSYTNEHNFETLAILAQDECCHSNTVASAACFVDESNKAFAEFAAKMKDYRAINRMYKINDFSEIRDMRSVNTREYHPQWADIEELSFEQLKREKSEVARLLRNRGFIEKEIRYVQSFMDDETVKVIKMLAEDKDCPVELVGWASGYANIENEALMRYALSLKDYDALDLIADGRIRTKSEINLRQAKHSSSSTSSNNTSSRNTKKGWTKEQFINHIKDVLSSRRFKTQNLKDSEVRNLAKLLGTTPEQVVNMDKKEYHRLSVKYHPDKVNNEEKEYFSFVNALFNGK